MPNAAARRPRAQWIMELCRARIIYLVLTRVARDNTPRRGFLFAHEPDARPRLVFPAIRATSV